MIRQKVIKFEDLLAWQEARVFNKNLYKELLGCRELFFRNQILKASLSVSSNIAEGFERGLKSNKEYIRFLHIAKASCSEIRSQLYLAIDIELLPTEKGTEFLSHCRRISYLINRLIIARERIEKLKI